MGRYRIVGPLAAGGMAEILLAVLVGKHGFERPVVIKRILPHMARDPEFVEMFIDEARIVADLHHPNVVQVMELEHSADQLFLVMEYLEGEPISGLMRRLRASGKLIDPALGAYVIACACAGLHAAHELKSADGVPRNLVHRDVTPQNVFVTYDGAVKVLDFGIAKASDRITRTEAGQFKGKEGYLAPEQCLGQPLDRRADVFALGILLYELTTGRRLFKGATMLESLQKVVSGAFALPSGVCPGYPPELEKILLRALAKEKDERFPSAAEMRRALLSFTQVEKPGEALDESLASLMQGLFPERIAQKKQAIRSLARGTDPVVIPAAEVDLSVELPAAGSASRARLVPLAPVGSLPPPSRSEPAPAPARRPVWLGIVGVVVLLALIGGAGLVGASLSSSDEPEAMAALPPPAATEPTPPESEPVPPPSEPVPVEPATVRVVVVSVPPGASVRLGEVEHGVTPVTLNLPLGEDAVDLTLRLEGYETLHHELTPDMTQRLSLALRRLSSRTRDRPPPTKNVGGFRAFD